MIATWILAARTFFWARNLHRATVKAHFCGLKVLCRSQRHTTHAVIMIALTMKPSSKGRTVRPSYKMQVSDDTASHWISRISGYGACFWTCRSWLCHMWRKTRFLLLLMIWKYTLSPPSSALRCSARPKSRSELPGNCSRHHPGTVSRVSAIRHWLTGLIWNGINQTLSQIHGRLHTFNFCSHEYFKPLEPDDIPIVYK